MADAVTLQLACFMAGMSDSPRKARTAQTCGTADAQQLEHVSGEMMVSMNQQQEITIKTMEETMQKGLKQVSKFPDHLGPMLEGVCGLRAVLPHPERISDPKVREYFRAAHRELGELQEGAVNKVSLLQTQAGTCRGMMMALGTLIQKLHRTCLSESTKMMKYDSEVVRDQIDQIRFFAQEMSKYSEDWTHFKKKCGTSALVEIESLIPAATANATMSSSDEALKKFAKIQSDIRVLIASKFQQMYVLDCSRAALEDVKKSREAEEEALKDLETRQVELEKQKKLLEEARKGESDNFRQETEKLKTNLSKWQDELESRKKDNTEQKQAQLQERSRQFDAYQSDIEKALLETRTSVHGNHLILLIDVSSSMSWWGKWQATLTAFDALKAARGPEGTNDTMSLVLFNHGAQVPFANEPLMGGNTTLSATPFGGTCFAAAWLEVKKIAALTNEAHRPVVVMMTDGETSESDVSAAASTAQEVRKLHPSLITFVIALGGDVKAKNLEPIVMAGNGGNKVHSFGDRKVPLLVQASARTLTKTFRTIASTVSLKEYEMKRQLEFLQEQRSAQQKQTEQSLADLQKTHKILNDSAIESSRILQIAKQEDSIRRQEMIDGQIKHCHDCQRHLNEQIWGIRDKISMWKRGEVFYEKESIPKLEEELATTENNYTEAKESLQSMQRSEGSGQLKKIAEERERLLKQVGTTDDGDMSKLLHKVQKYLQMRAADTAQTSASESFAANIKCFTHTIANVLEDPCHATKTPYVCKYDYIMDFYRKELGLPVKPPMNSGSNYMIVLQYHWNQLMFGNSEKAVADPKVLELIVKQIEPLELCELLDADQNQETVTLEKFFNNMEQEVLNAKPELRKCVAKIGKEKQKKKTLEDKVEKLQEKIQSCEDKRYTSREQVLDVEQVEKYDEEIEELREKLEDLNDQIRDVKSITKELEEEKKESLLDDGRLPDAKALVKHTLRGLQKAYHYRMSEWQKHCLMVHLESMQNVVEQMKQCIEVAETSNNILSEHALSRQSEAIAPPNPELKVLMDMSFHEPNAEIGQIEPELID